MSAHGVDERMTSVRYYINLLLFFHSSSCMFSGVL